MEANARRSGGDRKAQRGEAALSTYDRIAKAKGTAVSEAINQKCSACQMMVRPQRWNDLRDRDNDGEMMTCESCGRLLFYDPARDAPQRRRCRRRASRRRLSGRFEVALKEMVSLR